MSIEMLRRIRYAAIAAIVVLSGVLAAAEFGLFRREAAAPALGGPALGAFVLTDQNGMRVTEHDVIGRPAAIFFGFTSCPDVCPTTLTSLTALLQRLGADADRFGVFFVTVDPDRDNPAALKAYLSSFDSRIRGLTGTAAQLKALTKPLGVFHERVGEGDNYTVDHTASVFLLNAEGRFQGTIAYGEDADVALEKLRGMSTR